MIINTKVQRITETEEARTASMRVVGGRVGMFQSIELDVPAEQPLSCGDIVIIDVQWPEAE